MKQDYTYEDDDGNEITISLPVKMEVCPECSGTGFVLAGGLRGASFTSEEFYECFDDPESREAYFTRGSYLDEQCDVCHGKNVVPVIDEDNIPAKDRAAYEAYEKHAEEQAQFEAEYAAECAAERRMGC